MNYIEVAIKGNLDAGEFLSFLEEGSLALGCLESEDGFRLYYPEDKWGAHILSDLELTLSKFGLDSRDRINCRTVPDQDWNAAWIASLEPVRIGRRVRVRQSWHPAEGESNGIELVIDPKRAFGTGYHATTQLVLEWLENRISGGERVLDIGTGSGILAMVAIRLGARSAVGIDNDPVAIECAREYGSVNGFGPELELRVSSYEDIKDGPFDVVLANMDIRSLPQLCRRLAGLLQEGGTACLSGLQPQDYDEVAGILNQTRLRIRSRTARDEWIALHVE